MDDIWVVIGCIAVIVIGVAVIAYVLFRTPKAPASIGDVPSIDLGETPEVEEPAETDPAQEPAEPEKTEE